MSSRIRPGCTIVAMTLAAALGACVDPEGKFDEFNQRVVDATTNQIDGSGGLFEIDGEFLLSIGPSIAPNSTLRFAVTSDITIDGTAGTLSLSFQPLASENCDEGNGGNEVGEVIEASDLPVDEGGAFNLTTEGVALSRLANDVTCSDIVADLVLDGLVKSEDMFCGDVSGRVVTTGSNLEGSTFGAIRIEPGTRGDANLPEPLKACP